MISISYIAYIIQVNPTEHDINFFQNGQVLTGGMQPDGAAVAGGAVVADKNEVKIVAAKATAEVLTPTVQKPQVQQVNIAAINAQARGPVPPGINECIN